MTGRVASAPSHWFISISGSIFYLVTTSQCHEIFMAACFSLIPLMSCNALPSLNISQNKCTLACSPHSASAAHLRWTCTGTVNRCINGPTRTRMSPDTAGRILLKMYQNHRILDLWISVFSSVGEATLASLFK